MGKLIGHIVPGLVLACLGFWHTFNTVRSYCINGPGKFTSRFWHPLKIPFCKLENLELILIFSFSIFAIFVQFLDTSNTSYLHFVVRMEYFEHATMFVHLALFSGFTLFGELNHMPPEILSAVSRILAASVFGQEFFLLHYHSTDHVGIEGHYHWLLQVVVFVSLLASSAAALSPSSFPAAFVLSISVSLQGFWFIIMGFMLWSPEFVPQGCTTGVTIGSRHGAVICGAREAELRAVALANLQLSLVLSGILVLVVVICFRVSRNPSPRGQSTDYKQLQCGTGDVSMAVTSFKHILP